MQLNETGGYSTRTGIHTSTDTPPPIKISPNQAIQETSSHIDPKASIYLSNIFIATNALKAKSTRYPDAQENLNALSEKHDAIIKKIACLDSQSLGALDNPETSEEIEQFIDSFIEKLENSREVDAESKELIRQSFYFYFEAFATTKHPDDDSSLSEFGEKALSLIKDANTKLLDWLTETKDKDPQNEKIYQSLIRTLRENFREYDLDENKQSLISTLSIGGASRILFGLAPYFMKNIFGTPELDSKVTEGFTNKLWEFLEPALLSGSAYLGGSAVTTFAANQQADLLEKFSNALNTRIANTLIYNELEFGERKSIAEINTILEKGKASQLRLMQYSLSSLGPSGFGLGVSLAGLSIIHPVLFAIAPINMALLKLSNNKRYKKLRSTQASQNDSSEQASKLIETIKRSIEDIKVSANTQEIQTLLRELGREVERNAKEKEKQTNWTRLFSSIPLWATKLCTIGISGALMASGQIDHGEVLASFLYSESMSYNFDMMQDIYYKELPKIFEDIKRMDELLNSLDASKLPDSDEERRRKPVSIITEHSISIRNLGFENIHKDLNLEIAAGDFVTIVGANGSGKSTLLKLMLGLYDSSEGSIKIGGHDIKDLKRYGEESIYHSLIGYGRQDPAMLDGFSLRDNLTLARKKGSISDEDIIEILKSLEMHDFIDKLDDINLVPSGGQLMKIGLARALIKNPQILILDEPSNDIDAKSKKALFKAIDQRRKKNPNMIVITISHDPEITQRKDVRVIEMQEINGNLVK